jgi:NADH-quinone oxidoreductase subunit M
MSTLLFVTILLPAIGAVVVCLLADQGASGARQTALVTSLLTLALAAVLAANFDPPADPAAPFAASTMKWLGPSAHINVEFSLGLDGLSIWLFALSALLLVTCVLVSWHAIADRAAVFYSLLLLLGSGMLGVFAARDLILFYIFFEFTLIPLFFLIGVWGSEDRRYAAVKFFLFSLAGSLLTVLGLLTIVLWNYNHSDAGQMTFSIHELTAGLAAHPIAQPYQLWLFLALFAGFAIKVPLFPLHTWLPLAHTQAPTAGSVLLAGVLLKIGTYGFARFSIPMLPEATAMCIPWILALSAAGIVYGALVALVQTDMKRLIAYSSVSHLGFVMLGLFALTSLGVEGGVLQMVNHGLSTGGLFAIVGMIYERYHTREIAQFGGIARRTPILAFFFLLFTFSSIGLPGMNGFVGEFMILAGMFQRAWTEAPAGFEVLYKVIAVASVSGVVLGAWYMLYLVQRVFFGPLREPAVHGHDDHGQVAAHADHGDFNHGHDDHGHDDHGHGAADTIPPSSIRDLSFREIMAVAPLVVFMFWIGLHPEFFLSRMQATLEPMTRNAQMAVERMYGAPTGIARDAQDLSTERVGLLAEGVPARDQ